MNDFFFILSIEILMSSSSIKYGIGKFSRTNKICCLFVFSTTYLLTTLRHIMPTKPMDWRFSYLPAIGSLFIYSINSKLFIFLLTTSNYIWLKRSLHTNRTKSFPTTTPTLRLLLCTWDNKFDFFFHPNNETFHSI